MYPIYILVYFKISLHVEMFVKCCDLSLFDIICWVWGLMLISTFSRCVLHFGGEQKKASNNNIKCGKRLIGYSTINCTTNYTTTEKYCKCCKKLSGVMAFNVSDSACIFNNLLATFFFLRNVAV